MKTAFTQTHKLPVMFDFRHLWHCDTKRVHLISHYIYIYKYILLLIYLRWLTVNNLHSVFPLFGARRWSRGVTYYLFRIRRCPSSVAHRLFRWNKLLADWMRPTRALNWCNDGERKQFPSLPTSWWLCSEGPGGEQFIMCPSSWPCHWRNRQAHVCMNYPPSHLPAPASLPPSWWRFDTEGRERERENMGLLESARVLKCIFTVSIKT